MIRCHIAEISVKVPIGAYDVNQSTSNNVEGSHGMSDVSDTGVYNLQIFEDFQVLRREQLREGEKEGKGKKKVKGQGEKGRKGVKKG